MNRLQTAPRLTRNAIILLLSSGGSVLLSLVLSVIIGRYLGETGLGVYASALAWIAPITLLLEFGISTLLTREIAANALATRSLVDAALKARLWFGAVLCIAVFLAAPLLSQNPLIVIGIQWSTALIWVQPVFSTYTSVFRARYAVLPVAVLNLSMLSAQIILTLFILAHGYSIVEVFIVNTSTSLAQLFVAWLIYRLRFRIGECGQAQVRHLLQRAAPFAIAALLAAVHLRMNILWLEQTWGSAQAGYYAAAGRFSEAARLASIAFFDAAFPVLVSLSSDHSRLRKFLVRMLAGMGSAGLGFALLSTLFGPSLLLLLFGEAFQPAVWPMVILGWAMIPLLLKSTLTFYGYVQGDEVFVNFVTLAALGGRIFLCAALIPPYGVTGAALAQLLTELLGAALLAIRHIPLKQRLKRAEP